MFLIGLVLLCLFAGAYYYVFLHRGKKLPAEGCVFVVGADSGMGEITSYYLASKGFVSFLHVGLVPRLCCICRCLHGFIKGENIEGNWFGIYFYSDRKLILSQRVSWQRASSHSRSNRHFQARKYSKGKGGH